MRFRDLNVGTKLLVPLGLLSAALLAMVAFNWYAMTRAGDHLAAALEYSREVERTVNLSRKAQVDFKVQLQEWKNLLIRGGTLADYDKYSATFQSSYNDVERDLRELIPNLKTLGLTTTTVDKALVEHEKMQVKYLEALKRYERADPLRTVTVDSAIRGIDHAPTKLFDDIVIEVRARAEVLAKEIAAAGEAEKALLVVWRVLGIVFGVVGMVLGWRIVRGIVAPLQLATAVAERVASGDLTGTIEAGGNDETGRMLQALGKMTAALAALVADVRSGAEAVTTASTEIAAGSLELSSRTEQQASSIEETAASLEELTGTVNHNAKSAQEADRLADSASAVAHRGGEVVNKVVQTMDGIQGSSKRISDIIGVIDGIAFQTNILALNAAVEAARAGEQGRGFAVVATEVRSLAQRSAAAAKEIKQLITASVESVETGTRLVDEAGKTMQEVVDSVTSVSKLIGEMATATREQSAGINQVNVAVQELEKVTQQNASLVEESAAAAESLKGQAHQLARTVSVFKVDRKQASKAAASDAAVVEMATASHRSGALPRAAGWAKRNVLPARRALAVEEEGWKEF